MFVVEDPKTPEQILLDAWRWVLSNIPSEGPETREIFANCITEIQRETRRSEKEYETAMVQDVSPVDDTQIG